MFHEPTAAWSHVPCGLQKHRHFQTTDCSNSAFTLATCCHTCHHTSRSTCCSPCISMEPFTLATCCSTCVRECCWYRSHWRHVATQVANVRQFHSPEVAAARRLVAESFHTGDMCAGDMCAHIASVKAL